MTYTVDMIYKSALSIMGETKAKAKGYGEFIVDIVNERLADLFEINNSILFAQGELLLKEIPSVGTLADVLTYDEMLLRDCLHYGVASLLVLDDDTDKAGFFESSYENRKNKYKKAMYTQITDVY